MRSTTEADALRRSSALAFAVVFALTGLLKAAPAQNDIRPRRVAETAASSGPTIRVALMTDVSAVTLSCQSGLAIGEETVKREKDDPLARQIRVEVKQGQRLATKRSKPAYRILVATFDDRDQARRLTNELRRRYREPIAVEESKKDSTFGVSMGPFESQEDTEDRLHALRKEGYKSARLEQVRNSVSSDGLLDSSRHSSKDRSKAESPARLSISDALQLIATDGGRILASSSDRLVVAVFEAETEKRRDTTRGAERPSSSAGQYDFAREPRGQRRDSGEETERQPINAEQRPPSDFVRVDGKPYRGEIEIVLNKRGRANVINTVALEDYLRSVVPMELSPLGFPEMEALKAQAVAARSYALFHGGDRENEGYDLRDDARSQVYGGVNAEHVVSDRAIQETAGTVATAPGEDGRWLPIDAMYTANCGGHTENNEDVFGTKPRAYLRAVACDLDPFIATGRELVSNRQPRTITAPDGRSLAREVALFEVMGFLLPRQMNARYLSELVDESELRAWSERAAGICGPEAPAMPSAVGLAGFAQLVVSAVFGEGRASVLVTPSDASYILTGLEIPDGDSTRPQNRLSPQARASIAFLLKTGVLRFPAGTAGGLNAPVSRALAIETLGRALISRLRDSDSLNPVTSQKREPLKVVRSVSGLEAEIATGVEAGRLVVGSSRSVDGNLIASAPPRGYVTVETSAARIGRGVESSPESTSARRVSGPAEGATGRIEIPRALEAEKNRATGLEVAQDARLFRELGGEIYPVTRVTLIGGERVLYHLNPSGQIDFLEASSSDRSAATDRFSRVAAWQQRITADEITGRLSRGRGSVGQPESITPIAFSTSGRVTDLEIIGSAGSSRLHGSQIKSVLGLRENMFVVDPEMDSKGRVVAFVFTGRGWGHGVGMCQTGAYGLARAGYSYKQILQKYYTGVRIEKIY